MAEERSSRSDEQTAANKAGQVYAFVQHEQFPRFSREAQNQTQSIWDAPDNKNYVLESLENSEIGVVRNVIDNNGKEKTGKSHKFRVKRFFDFVSSLCASLVLLIPMAAIAVLIMVKDPGNPFYVQKRVGQNGKVLNLVKFRSMRKGADRLEEMLTPEQLKRYKREYKLDDDPRLIGYKKPGDSNICFGAILRKTSLDELPQLLFNICIKGDMSVVGPRPILKDELEEHYSPEQQDLFLSVKPGLTGYWQAYARNDATYESGQRQRMELFYVHNNNIAWDVTIIFATITAVLRKRGAK